MVPEYKKIRLKFSKLGALKFISHLDLDRTMKSAITRSGVKIEYTHGYNPRPHLVFSLPAALGIGSVCEFLDIKAADISPDDVKDRLNDALPPDLRIIEAYEPRSNKRNVQKARRYRKAYEKDRKRYDAVRYFSVRGREILRV